MQGVPVCVTVIPVLLLDHINNNAAGATILPNTTNRGLKFANRSKASIINEQKGRTHRFSHLFILFCEKSHLVQRTFTYILFYLAGVGGWDYL